MSFDGRVPNDAVKAGYDVEADELIYVARARPPGVVGTHAGRIMNGETSAVISHNGKEHRVDNFKILCRKLITFTSMTRPSTS